MWPLKTLSSPKCKIWSNWTLITILTPMALQCLSSPTSRCSISGENCFSSSIPLRAWKVPIWAIFFGLYWVHLEFILSSSWVHFEFILSSSFELIWVDLELILTSSCDFVLRHLDIIEMQIVSYSIASVIITDTWCCAGIPDWRWQWWDLNSHQVFGRKVKNKMSMNSNEEELARSHSSLPSCAQGPRPALQLPRVASQPCVQTSKAQNN